MDIHRGLPIGVFDSGLGGLTVIKELSRRLPKEKFIYVGDTARVPYGTKSPDTIKRYALQIAFFLLRKQVKTIVVACNSASSVALNALKRFPVPVIGVIDPGARAATRKSKTKRIGVIGTQATIASQAYHRAIKGYLRGARVWSQACPLFVPLVEEGRLNDPITRLIAAEYLKPFKKRRIDTLVLGCTHYPLLKGAFRQVLSKNVALIDSAEETAREVELLLQKKNQLNQGKRKGGATFYTTDNPIGFKKFGFRFLGQSTGLAHYLPLESL